ESELIVKAQEPEQPTPPPELPVEKKVVVTLERSIPQPNAEPSETAREMGTEETIEELENNTRLESND
ncbi:MAG TPA: hypothetical protein VHA52_03705, partial [Candidatus Babeliaceae bacterium]|nr:hypothetical protein [Candidatus Babeliaceae bacterium]